MKIHPTKLKTAALCALFLVPIFLMGRFSSDAIALSRLAHDRNSLETLLQDSEYDNDVVTDSFIIRADQSQPFRGVEQLGLRRDRLAYLVKEGDTVAAVVLPATAEDGFNGFVDLLIAINQYGRIEAASVVEDFEQSQSVGLIALVQSAWFDTFSQKTLRDVRMLSLKPITAENEYDQFVGASITPNLVADRVYDTLVFYQTNRIALTRFAEQAIQQQ